MLKYRCDETLLGLVRVGHDPRALYEYRCPNPAAIVLERNGEEHNYCASHDRQEWDDCTRIYYVQNDEKYEIGISRQWTAQSDIKWLNSIGVRWSEQ